MQKRKSARCLHLFVLAQVEFKKFENKLNDAEKEFKAAQTTCGAKSMEYVDANLKQHVKKLKKYVKTYNEDTK